MSSGYGARLRDARTLQSLGWALVPLAPYDKHPYYDLLPRNSAGKVQWKQLGIDRPSKPELARWFSHDATCNVGVVCGRASGGLIVFDFDELPSETMLATSTPIAKTARGDHFFFKDERCGSSSFPGGEILGNGKYVVVPPSVHQSGHVYHWVNDPWNTELAAVPPCFRSLSQNAREQVSSRTTPPYSDTRDTRLHVPTGKEWVKFYECECSVRRMLPALGIPADVRIGQAFACVLPGHTETRPSASLHPNESGRFVYHDWHGRGAKRVYTLPQVRALIAGRGPHSISASEQAVWGLRLCVEANLLELPTLRTQTPPELTDDARRAYESFLFLLAVRWLHTPDVPAPFAYRFARAWTELSMPRVARALRELKVHGLLRKVGRTEGIDLYLPPFDTRATP